MEDESTPYLAPPDEIIFRLPSRGEQPTQVWRVPVEPRMKITRGGEPRRDWPLLLQTGGLLIAAALLPLWFLAQKPAPHPKMSTSSLPKTAPQTYAKIQTPAAPSPAPRLYDTPRFSRAAANEPPRYTVPPAAPTR